MTSADVTSKTTRHVLLWLPSYGTGYDDKSAMQDMLVNDKGHPSMHNFKVRM